MSRRPGRVVAKRSVLKGHVDDHVVLQLHGEDRVRRARYPARGRYPLERDDTEVSKFPFPSTAGQHRAPFPLSWDERLPEGPSGPHVRDHLAEEARCFEDRRLRLHKFTPATEHIQREREGPGTG